MRWITNLLFDYLNDAKFHELPIFSLEEVATATNNFHVANMLGQGGFGPVYRVMLDLSSSLVPLQIKSVCAHFFFCFFFFFWQGKIA